MEVELFTMEVQAFMRKPIITWFTNCLPGTYADGRLTFDDVVDGVLMYDVFLKMNIDGQSTDVTPSYNNPAIRLANLQTLMRRMSEFYEDRHDEVILRRPDVRLIADVPRESLRDVDLLLQLLLGCAIKCQNNEYFVQKISLLDEHTQQSINTYVKQVLYFPIVVLSQQMLLVADDELHHHELKVYQAFLEIRRINRERNELIEQLHALTLTQDCERERNEWITQALSLSEQLNECRRKLATFEIQRQQFDCEVRYYRDAFESTLEKANRSDRLAEEVAYYKARCEEAQNDRAARQREHANELNAREESAERKIREMKKEIGVLQRRCIELDEELDNRLENTAEEAESESSEETSEDSESYDRRDRNMGEQPSGSRQQRSFKVEPESRRRPDDSRQQIAELTNENRSLELVNFSLHARIDQLEQAAASTNAEKTQLRALVDEAQRRSDVLEIRVAELESEKDNVDKIVERLRMRAADAAERNQDASSSTSAEVSPPGDKVTYEQLFSEYRNLLKERNSLEGQLREAKLARLDYASHPKYIELNRDFMAMLAEYNFLQAKNRDLERANEDYKTESIRINAEVLDYVKQNGELSGELDELKEDNKRLKSYNDTLKKSASHLLEENQQMQRRTLADESDAPSRESRKRSAPDSEADNATVKLRRTSESFGVNRLSSLDASESGPSRVHSSDTVKLQDCKDEPKSVTESISFDREEN